ncbi:P-loop NTPase fold protein [Blautia sp. OF03-13]|uniref:P-loop NTPase fold protein n=1 Tax=Blautia sp. OF03-13 TaxID=2292980 RepID=UPI000E48485B|nr:hypothetical protein DXA55_13245 [Blautia sp. OF03-13]
MVSGEDQTYNYAVLIDGEWGSGKTYFVKKIIVPRLTSKKNFLAQTVRLNIFRYMGAKILEMFRKILPGHLQRMHGKK